ncbi:MAG: tyrosine-type recombinase/integrase [Thermoanaerobaculia bacterium]
MAPSPLRLRMQQIMRVRNYSERTQKIYLGAVAKFAAFFHRSPEKLGSEEILTYQLHLRDVRHVSFTFFNQIMSALRFFYGEVLERDEMVQRIPYMRRERRLPVVLSAEELLRLLEATVSLRDRALITLTYSAGLRLGEACRLSVADIDSSRMMIRVRQGKGHKDRYVPLSPVTLELLRAWWRASRPRELLFPAKKDPSRPIHHSTFQRALRIAARRAGITKPVSPRTLRHSFATHLMEQGTSMRVIQILLGHAHIRTTETYTHVSPGGARSPLDHLTPPETR